VQPSPYPWSRPQNPSTAGPVGVAVSIAVVVIVIIVWVLGSSLWWGAGVVFFPFFIVLIVIVVIVAVVVAVAASAGSFGRRSLPPPPPVQQPMVPAGMVGPIPLNCPNCGAPPYVVDRFGVAVCNHCGTRFLVR